MCDFFFFFLFYISSPQYGTWQFFLFLLFRTFCLNCLKNLSLVSILTLFYSDRCSQTSVQVPSPASGVIEELLVPDGGKVEGGTPLFKLRKGG